MNIKCVTPMCALRVAVTVFGLLALPTSVTATTYAYTYDTSGRLQAIDTPTKKILYTFDATGNQTSVAVQAKGMDGAVDVQSTNDVYNVELAVLQLDIDTDGDGIPDALETANGLDPCAHVSTGTRCQSTTLVHGE